MTTIRVLVVEDEPLIAEDIREYLTAAGYLVTTVAYNMDEAVQSLQDQVPDIALLDINLGGNMDGLSLASLINERYFIPFIFLTSYSHQSVIEQAKVTRPMGYILKPFNQKDLYSSVEIALYNHAQSPRPRHFSLERLNQQIVSPFTEKEFEILQDIYEGYTNKQLADKHFLSINTIKTHVHSIYDKLGVHSRSEAIAELRRLLL